MKDKIYYYDRNGVLKLTLNQYPYYTEWSDLRNWVWSYNEQFGRFNSFYRNKQDRSLVIGIAGDYLKHHDDLCDIFAADIIAGQPGQLIVNGWALNCYIVEAEYEYAWSLSRKAEFKVVSDDPAWIRTNTRVFSGESEDVVDQDYGRDYTFEDNLLGRGYNYGYSLASTHIVPISLPGSENGYEVTFYGPIVNPIIYINNHPIKVLIEVDSGERLRITSNGSEKTIKLLSQSGQETDAFIYRDKENSPFVSLGSYSEITFGEIRFDFTTIERRSEPTWT